MNKINFQEKKWSGDFGKKYTGDVIKNPMTIKETDKLYIQMYGISRTKLNDEFLDKFNRSIKILEVGCNIGVQLLYLQKMGFKNLYGIELNQEVIEIGRPAMKNINVIQGSALDIPFKDNYFDLVFTSGVLIHISPLNIKTAIKEIHRCSKQYVLGLEYFDEKYTVIPYHGCKNLLWKTNFSKLYLDSFKDLKLVKEKRIKYLCEDNIDTMFLLKKNEK
jgi:pseudaminic acid biosynthesis-associated methylase